MHVGRFWLSRTRSHICIADRRRGYGVTLHRDGGVSVVGIPEEGGTSILWGSTGEFVRQNASDLRYRRDFGRAIVVSGSDF